MRCLLAWLLLCGVAIAQTEPVPKSRSYGLLLNDSNDRVTDDRPLPMVEYGRHVALGYMARVSTDTKFGRNADVDTTTDPEDIWHGQGTYTGHPTGAPETVEVFSSDADDTSAGTGARTIRFFGLKAATSTEYETEDITMNGVTAVTSSATWYRVNRAYVLTAGSSGSNEGDITIRHTTTTANVFAVMPATLNQTQIMAYTVPAERQILIVGIRFGIARANGGAGSAHVTLRTRESGGVYRARRNFELHTGQPIDLKPAGGLLVPAKADIKATVEEVSDNNTVCEGGLEFILMPD